ncbi:hypothetical protein QUF74_16770 [Candidatus Halobeggiatoa sp. HSG11]|nr:hypothetical protein [Candidatus Halobeggiatoa sp. HSG11]
MKLIVKKEQHQSDKKSLFSGQKSILFSLFAKIEITQEEQELIDKYRVGDRGLIWATDSDGDRFPILTVKKLVQGYTKDSGDINILITFEEELKSECKKFKAFLEIMESFGGDEIIEI